MRRKQRFVVFVIRVLWLVAPACRSSPSEPTPTSPFVVVGQVIDFQSKASMPGATVSFGDPSSATVLPGDPRSLTDSGGSYQLAVMPGRYHVWVDTVYRGEALIPGLLQVGIAAALLQPINIS